MNRTTTLIVSLLSVIGSVGLAQAPSSLSGVTISYTISVPAHAETFIRRPLANITDRKLYGSEYAVRNSPTSGAASQITATGSLLNLPQFAWLKGTNISNKIGATQKSGGARIKFKGNMLVRESNFNATTGKTSGTFFQVYSVNTVKNNTGSNFIIPMSSVDTIRQSMETQVETASNSVLAPLVSNACQGMCTLKFVGSTATGLDQDNIPVTVVPDGAKPGQKFEIDWPAYTITSTFTLAPKTAQDMATESGGN